MLKSNNLLRKIILLLIVSAAVSSTAPRVDPQKICATEECKISSDILKSSMDTNINPCDNFYKYACGNFPQYKKAKFKEDEQYDWFAEARRLLNAQIQNFLSSRIEKMDSIDARNAKKFFQSCTDTDSMNRKGLETINQVLKLVNISVNTNFGKQYHADPNFDWTVSAAKMKINLNIDFLISVESVTDPDTGVNFLFLGYPTICSPSINNLRPASGRINTENVFESKEFESYTDAVSMHLIENSNNTLVRRLKKHLEFKQFQEFSQLREDICVDSKLDTLLDLIVDSHDSIQMMTLEELQFFTDRRLHRYAKINWKKYLDVVFEGIDGVTLSEEDVLLVNQIYLKRLLNLIRTTPSRILELAAWFDVVTSVLPYTTNEMRQLDSEYKQQLFNSSEILGSPESCSKVTAKYMRLAILHHMVDNSEVNNHKYQVEEMMTHLKIALEKLIEKSTWMDRNTKVTAIEKIKEMKSRISHSPWLKNTTFLDTVYKKMNLGSDFVQNMISLNRAQVINELQRYINKSEELDDDLIGNPLEVNAFYEPRRNMMTVPLGILQRPFYGHPLQVLNYAALGSIIGHEISHGLDTSGMQYNEKGEKSEWWTNTTLRRYNERTHCFVDSYTKMKIGNHSLDGNSTIDENIADNGGVREALMAYREYENSYGKEPLLIGFETFTHDQLFTLAFANVWCEHPTERTLEMDFIDTHSPNEVRVLGVFQNSEEFSEVWKCPKGSPMNPYSSKCRLWRK